jgi:uncharacterized protein YkwD
MLELTSASASVKQKAVPVMALVIFSVFTFMVSVGFFLYLLVTSSSSSNKPEFITYNKDQVIVAINLQRKIFNLPPLITNDKLSLAADNKAKDLSKNQYFSHIDPITNKKWSDFIVDSNYNYEVAGENLANGFYDTNSMIKAWMNSPTHRENVLNSSVDETGIGISTGTLQGTPTIFVVQMFGKLDTES